MDEEKLFVPINAGYCLKERAEQFLDGIIVLGDASVFSGHIYVIPCDNIEVSFGSGALWGNFKDVREFYLRSREKAQPTKCEKAHGALFGRNIGDEHALWDSIADGFPHVDLENRVLRTGTYDTIAASVRGMPKNTLAKFAFSFVSGDGFGEGSIDGSYNKETIVNFEIEPLKVGAYGCKKAVPYGLKYALGKFRAKMIEERANYNESGEFNSRDVLSSEDVKKMYDFILEDIKTGKHTKASREYGPEADALMGL